MVFASPEFAEFNNSFANGGPWWGKCRDESTRAYIFVRCVFETP